MTYTVVWSHLAEIKLQAIVDYYTENASLSVAKKLAKTILNTSLILEKKPQIGPIEELLSERIRGYRFIISGNYKLIYYIDEGKHEVRIADVFDTRQNPEKLKSVY